MEYQAREANSDGDEKPFAKQYKLFHAAFAQFCYTGAQVAIASFFINYVTGTLPGASSSTGSQLFAGAQAAFAVGRFFGAAIMKYVKPRWVFLVFLSGCIVFIGPPITHGGVTGIAMLYVVLFFESICFPTIMALGMRGLGRHTKRGSGYIVGGVVGGAVVPPLTGLAGDRHGDGFAMLVPMIFFIAAWTYAVCANFAPPYVGVIDSFGEADVGLRRAQDDVEHSCLGEADEKAAGEHVGAKAADGSGGGAESEPRANSAP